jgi:hypothetical protein
MFYCFASICIKSGICLALIRLGAHKRSVYFPAIAVMAISILAGLVTFVIGLCICKPIDAEWYPTGGKCLSPSVTIDISYLISAASILTDFSCAILPIVLLWGVQMNWKIKWSIACILSFGFL